jgi:5-methylcytosine-specific restriction endonuclease McrA
MKVGMNCSQCGAFFMKRHDRVVDRNYCSRQCLSASQATPGSRWSSHMPNKQQQAAYMKAYVAANRERHNERGREWAKANRDSRNATQRRRRALGCDTRYPALKDQPLDKAAGCVACGSHRRLEVDHIVPVSRGGSSERANLQLLCRTCNASKGARTMQEWLEIKRGWKRALMLYVHGVEVTVVKA